MTALSAVGLRLLAEAMQMMISEVNTRVLPTADSRKPTAQLKTR
jgi:hypothetical protein